MSTWDSDQVRVILFKSPELICTPSDDALTKQHRFVVSINTESSLHSICAPWSCLQVVPRPGLENGFDGIDWDMEGCVLVACKYRDAFKQ